MTESPSPPQSSRQQDRGTATSRRLLHLISVLMAYEATAS